MRSSVMPRRAPTVDSRLWTAASWSAVQLALRAPPAVQRARRLTLRLAASDSERAGAGAGEGARLEIVATLCRDSDDQPFEIVQ